MEYVELAFTPGALGLDVHELQQVRIALGVEDDHHRVLAADLAADVLRDEQLGQPRLAHARGPQHQGVPDALAQRSEEHTSELQSLMRISYAVFCLKKKKTRCECYECIEMNTEKSE